MTEEGSAKSSLFKSTAANDTLRRFVVYAFVTEPGTHVRLRIGVVHKLAGSPLSIILCVDVMKVRRSSSTRRGKSTRLAPLSCILEIPTAWRQYSLRNYV